MIHFKMIHFKKIILSAISASVLCCSAFGQQYGIVKYSVNFMRNAPDYESALETQALMGTPVKILDRQGYWLKIKSPEPYIAWATDMGIVALDSLQLEEYIASPKYICTALWTEVYENADFNSQRISDLVAGDLLRVSSKVLKHKQFQEVLLPDGRKAYVKANDICNFRNWAETRKATPENVVSTAKKFLGTPYLWGGASSKGLDCSGLTMTAFMLNGILLHRNASQQIKEGIDVSLEGFVPEKNEGELKPGDLLFFGKKATEDTKEKVTHVAMYIGGGCIIHSSHEVRINSLNPKAENYYTGTPRLLRARRMCDADGNPYTSTRIVDSPAYFPQSADKSRIFAIFD